MSELSPEARALLHDGQGVLRPSMKDRARITGALTSRLGAAAMMMSTPALAAAKKSLLWQKVPLTAASAGLIVAGASYWWSPPSVGEAPRASSAPQRDVGDVVAPPAPVVREAEATVPQNESKPVLPEPAPVPPAKTVQADRLAEEVAILSRAMTVLRAGNANEALRMLDTHRQQFPTGRLVEERRAARVQALCALGKRSEAEAELSRLERSAPRSPHVARAKRACGLH